MCLIPRIDVSTNAEGVLVETTVHSTGIAACVGTDPVNNHTVLAANPVVLPCLGLDCQGLKHTLLLGLRSVCQTNTLLFCRGINLALGTAVVANALERGVEGLNGCSGGDCPCLGFGLPLAARGLDVLLEGIGVVACYNPALLGVACDCQLDVRKGLHFVCCLLLW